MGLMKFLRPPKLPASSSSGKEAPRIPEASSLSLSENREPGLTSPGSSNPRGNMFSRLRPGQKKGHNRSVTWVSASLSEEDHSIPLSMPGRDSPASASADGLKPRVDVRKVEDLASKSSLGGKRAPSKPGMVAKITAVDCMAPSTQGSPPPGHSSPLPLEVEGSSTSPLKDAGKERKKDGASKPPPFPRSDSSSNDVVPRFGAWHNTRLDASKISLLFKERAAKQTASSSSNEDGENGEQPGSEATASRVAAITAATGTSRSKKKAALTEDSPFIDLQAELAAATAEIQEMLAAERAGSSSSRREDIDTARIDQRISTYRSPVKSSTDVDHDLATMGSFGHRENDADHIDANVAGDRLINKAHSAETGDVAIGNGSHRVLQDHKLGRVPVQQSDGNNVHADSASSVSDLPVFGSWATSGSSDAVEISKVFREKASPVRSASGGGSQGGRVVARQASVDGLSGGGQSIPHAASGSFLKPERGRNPELVDLTPSWQSESGADSRRLSGGHDPVSFVAYLPPKSSSEDAGKGEHSEEEDGAEAGRESGRDASSSSGGGARTKGSAGTAGTAGSASRSYSSGGSAMGGANGSSNGRLSPLSGLKAASAPSVPAFGSWRKKAAVKSSEISQLFRPRTQKADLMPERAGREKDKQPTRGSSSSPLPRPQSLGGREDRESGEMGGEDSGGEAEVESSGELIPPAVPAFGAWRAGAVNADTLSQIFQATKSTSASSRSASEQVRDREEEMREVGSRQVPAFGTWRGSAGVSANTISQIFKGKVTAASAAEASAPASDDSAPFMRSDSNASEGGNSTDMHSSPSISKSPSAGEEEQQASSRYPANRFAASGRSNSGGRRKKVALSRSRQDSLSSDLERALSALAEMEGADECIGGEEVKETGGKEGGELLEDGRKETAPAAIVKLTDIPKSAEVGSFRFAGLGQEEPVSAVFGPPKTLPAGSQVSMNAEGNETPGSPLSPKFPVQSPGGGASPSSMDKSGKSFGRDVSQGGKQSLRLSAVWGVVEEADEVEDVSTRQSRPVIAGDGDQSSGKQGGIFARKRLDIKAPRERDGLDAEKAMMALIGCGFGDIDEDGNGKVEVDGMSTGNVSDLLKEAKQRFKKG